LAGLTITGTTIYVANNTRHHVKQVDVIEIVLGTYERCLATQYTSSPAYSVSPPSFVRTWINSNGVSENVTNAFGNYIDKSMLDTIDTKIKQLVPYYAVSNAPPDTWTVTSLWDHLDIGDGTNEFTSVPCWTNSTTNYVISYTNFSPTPNNPIVINTTSLWPVTVRYAYDFLGSEFYWTNRLFDTPTLTVTTNLASYGSYPQYIFTECLEERYKALESLRWMLADPLVSANGSRMKSYGAGGIFDLNEYTVSNKTTGALITEVYHPSYEAFVLGLKTYYDYSGTNYEVVVENYKQLSWDQVKTIHEWVYVSGGYSNAPPYARYPSGYIAPTNETSLDIKSYIGYYVTISTSTNLPDVAKWQWRYWAAQSYATWSWRAYYTNSQVSNTMVSHIFAKPELDVNLETSTNQPLPRSWDVTVASDFSEFSGMTTGVYSEIDASNIRISDGMAYIEIGSDEFPPLTSLNSFPTWCDQPTKGVDWNNNTGQIGKFRGMTVKKGNCYAVKEWNFLYCTNKYWN